MRQLSNPRELKTNLRHMQQNVAHSSKVLILYPPRFICSNRQTCQVKWSIHLPNFSEQWLIVASVSSKKEWFGRPFQHPAAPQMLKMIQMMWKYSLLNKCASQRQIFIFIFWIRGCWPEYSLAPESYQRQTWRHYKDSFHTSVIRRLIKSFVRHTWYEMYFFPRVSN